VGYFVPGRAEATPLQVLNCLLLHGLSSGPKSGEPLVVVENTG
jgi:hypothetical protein